MLQLLRWGTIYTKRFHCKYKQNYYSQCVLILQLIYNLIIKCHKEFNKLSWIPEYILSMAKFSRMSKDQWPNQSLWPNCQIFHAMPGSMDIIKCQTMLKQDFFNIYIILNTIHDVTVSNIDNT